MIKDIAVTAGNWIRFRLLVDDDKRFVVVGYHPGKADIQCTCRAYRPDKPCSHVEWLAKEFTYDKTFEDIRALIMEQAGVNYSYTVIEDLWDKCLKVTNRKLYESFKEGVKPERNPLKFKLERKGSFGVDTSTKPDRAPLTWQGRIPGSDQQWTVGQYSKNIFYVRMFPIVKIDRPWRTVERSDSGVWKSNCACSEGRACVHELAARTAYAAWLNNGLIEKKTDSTRVTGVTVAGLQNLKDSSAFAKNVLQEYQRYFLEELEKDLTANLISGKTATTVTVDEWKYMGPTAWGTKVFTEPYMKEEKQEPPKKEEPKPPPKPKNRFSEMEL